jgi:hypothetical protein
LQVAGVELRTLQRRRFSIDSTKIETREIMKYYILLLAPIASAFVVRPEVRLRPALPWQLKATKSTNPPVPSPLGFDKARAVECAETFGKCSIEEVKNIRDSKCPHLG